LNDSPYSAELQLIENQFAMLLECAEALFQRMEHQPYSIRSRYRFTPSYAPSSMRARART
jgi:hypothetical protein